MLYISSLSYGHSHNSSFKELHCDLDVHNMIQISVDEPIVNWKMVVTVNKHCKEQDPDAPSLLEIRFVAFTFFMVLIKQYSLLRHGS